jgi:ATP-binding cassette subfamily F protein 3
MHSALADADAYTVQSRGEQLLLGLGFSLDQMQQPVASFSGGWRMRLNLAQALMCPSDLLLLDEPTNHLDLDAIIWLEDWLKRYPGTLIIISHDRDFLDEDRERDRAHRRAQAEALLGQLLGPSSASAPRRWCWPPPPRKAAAQARPPGILRRPLQGQATKARQAQSRMKALAKMEELAPLRAAAEFSFEFREPLARRIRCW